MSDSTALYDALQEFFTVCQFALANGSIGGLPNCAYVSEGPPAWDTCPCLICFAGAPAVADTFPLQPALAVLHRIELGRQVNLVPFSAIILRCQAIMTDGGQLPQPADHVQPTQEILSDVWALWNYLAEARRQNVLFPSESGKREFGLEVGIAYNPAGAAAGSLVTVRTQIDGYSPDLTGLTV